MLSLSQLWNEDEEMTELPVMGTVGPFVAKDLKIPMEDISDKFIRRNNT